MLSRHSLQRYGLCIGTYDSYLVPTTLYIVVFSDVAPQLEQTSSNSTGISSIIYSSLLMKWIYIIINIYFLSKKKEASVEASF